jgi:hypothetical protein
LEVARVDGGLELLGAVRHPAHGAAEQAGGVQHQHVLGEQEVLEAEAAADVGAGEADAVLGHAEHAAGELGADVVDALAAQHEVEAVRRGVVPADGGARLDGRGVQALVHQIERDDVRGAGEGGFHSRAVAALEAEGLVARRLLPDLRRAGREGGAAVHGGGQGVVGDGDRFGGVVRLRRRVRDDAGHRLADVANAVAGEGVALRHDQRADRVHDGGAGKRAQAGFLPSRRR